MANNGKRLGVLPGWRKGTYVTLTFKHLVVDWSNGRHGTYHDVKYYNEHGEPQFLFNQLVLPTTKRRTSKAQLTPQLAAGLADPKLEPWHGAPALTTPHSRRLARSYPSRVDAA